MKFKRVTGKTWCEPTFIFKFKITARRWQGVSRVEYTLVTWHVFTSLKSIWNLRSSDTNCDSTASLSPGSTVLSCTLLLHTTYKVYYYSELIFCYYFCYRRVTLSKQFFLEGPRSRWYGRIAAWRLIMQPCDEDDEVFSLLPCIGAPVEWIWQGETKVLGEKPVQVPLCPQIPHGSNTGLRGERLATNRLSHGTALILW